MYSRARAAKAAKVSSSMATEGRRQVDQSAIWDEIPLKSERLGETSPTQAMNAIYDSTAVPIDAYLRAFVSAERQAGLIFAMGPEAMGLDLMDHPDAKTSRAPRSGLNGDMFTCARLRRMEPAGAGNSVRVSVVQPLDGRKRVVRASWGRLSGCAGLT
jgi:hypothetical protein